MNARSEFIAKWVFDDKGFVIGTERKEDLIRCKDCREHGQRTNMCSIWHHHTNPEGYCHRAKAVKKNDTE